MYVNHVRKSSLNGLIKQEQTNHFDAKPLTTTSYRCATVVPPDSHGGGLYDQNGDYVKWSNFNGNIEEHWAGECDYLDEDVLYIGMIFGVWGHCITDFLRHTWPLLSGKYKIAYTTVLPHLRIPDNYFEMLKALGVERDDIIRVESPTKFRSVVFSDPSFYLDIYLDKNSGGYGYFTREYNETIESIRDYFLNAEETAEEYDAVYLSRGGWKKGCVDFGESLVEKAFVKYYNCKVVRPEKLSIGEMINLLSHCKTLVATEGSVAHNSLFMRKGSKLISIRKSDYINLHQPVISQARDLDVIYIDANYTYIYPFGDEPYYGPFLLGVNDKLADFLHCPKSTLRELAMPFVRFTLRYVYMRVRKFASKCKARIVQLLK